MARPAAESDSTLPALGAGEDLALALAALTSFQQVTQQADAKASTLVALDVGLAALVATQVGGLADGRWPSGIALTLLILILIYLVSFLICGYALIQVVRPRQTPIGAANPFALETGPGAGPAPSVAHVWAVARGIADIAVIKNRYTGMAVDWSAVMVPTVIAWIALVTFARN
jgi:hypothetical protein